MPSGSWSDILPALVGAVCGLANGGSQAEGIYWRYENAISGGEPGIYLDGLKRGALHRAPPAHKPMNPQAANDFQHPLQVALQGYRCVYEPLAVAEEPAGRDEQ